MAVYEDCGHHGRARSQVADGEHDFYLIRTVADSPADSRQGWSSSLGAGRRSRTAVPSLVCV